jgi:hypothetical protein
MSVVSILSKDTKRALNEYFSVLVQLAGAQLHSKIVRDNPRTELVATEDSLQRLNKQKSPEDSIDDSLLETKISFISYGKALKRMSEIFDKKNIDLFGKDAETDKGDPLYKLMTFIFAMASYFREHLHEQIQEYFSDEANIIQRLGNDWLKKVLRGMVGLIDAEHQCQDSMNALRLKFGLEPEILPVFQITLILMMQYKLERSKTRISTSTTIENHLQGAK